MHERTMHPYLTVYIESRSLALGLILNYAYLPRYVIICCDIIANLDQRLCLWAIGLRQLDMSAGCRNVPEIREPIVV